MSNTVINDDQLDANVIGDAADAIRAVYGELVASPEAAAVVTEGVVPFWLIRQSLGDAYDREYVDAALRLLDRAEDVEITQLTDPTDIDHAAAVWMEQADGYDDGWTHQIWIAQ